MARPRKHKDNAAKVRHSRLARRARALKNFYGTVLSTLYLQRGFDPAAALILPPLDWDAFEKLAGIGIQEFIELMTRPDCRLDYIEVDRRGAEPRIRISNRAPKQEKQLV